MVSHPAFLTGLLAAAGLIAVVLGGYTSWHLVRTARGRAEFGGLGQVAGLVAVVELLIGAVTVVAIIMGQSLPPVWGATVAVAIAAGVVTFERYRSRGGSPRGA